MTRFLCNQKGPNLSGSIFFMVKVAGWRQRVAVGAVFLIGRSEALEVLLLQSCSSRWFFGLVLDLCVCFRLGFESMSKT